LDLTKCNNAIFRFARFNPLSQADRDLFVVVLAGENASNGFRNRDLCAKLYPHLASSDQEAKRRCSRISRLIAKLRSPGLVAKVKDAPLYRLTQVGSQVLFAVLNFYQTDFPTAFQNATY